MSTNGIEHVVLLKRLLIIFGSVCFVWLIIGFIFLSIQTYRHFKKRTKQNIYLYNRSLQFPIKSTAKRENISDNEGDEGDDLASLSTSVSFLSERSRIIHPHTRYPTSCQRIPEEPLEFAFPNLIGISNLAYSRSTLSSASDNDPSLLYYPGHRNFAYSQSTLCSSDSNSHEKTPTPSLNIPFHSFSSIIRQLHLKRQASQSSANTISSQNTNATRLSSQSSTKSIPLPTVMVTDVDRLQTDIIELDEFEPEKECRRSRSQLRFLLNDQVP